MPEILSRMFLAGAKNLEAKKEWINELNVFPVPDGDTGTNMTMTIMAAAAEVGSLESLTWSHWPRRFLPVPCAVPEVTPVLSCPSFFVVSPKEPRDTEMDAVVIAAAMEKGVETAYKAVMKPKRRDHSYCSKRGCCKGIRDCRRAEDLELFFRAIFAHAEKTLARTPDMLPVLKKQE